MAKKSKQPIGEKFFPVRRSLLESEIFNLLTGDDWIVFLKYGEEYKNEPFQLIEVKFKDVAGPLNNNRHRFARAKFHLAAFRLLSFPCLESRSVKGSRARISMKWKTLIHMPCKLEKIARWVQAVDKLKREQPKPNPKRSAILELRRRQIQKLKSYIFNEPV